MHDKEAAEAEQLRQIERELADRNEQQAREAAAIEAECEAVEQECAVLKVNPSRKSLLTCMCSAYFSMKLPFCRTGHIELE